MTSEDTHITTDERPEDSPPEAPYEQPHVEPRTEEAVEPVQDQPEPQEAAPIDEASDEPLTATVEATVETVEAPEPEAEADPVVAEAEAEPAVAETEVSVEAEAGDEEEEDEEDEEPDYMFQLGDWYVVHTYAGYENKVKANLASRIQSMNMEDKIYEVVVPTEEVMELKAGKMQSVQKKVFPGYILVRMELDDDSWYVVRNTPGVTGFVGPTGAKPVPLDPTEVASILQPKAEERARPQLEFETGEVVSVVGGAFNGYSGPVNAIDQDKQRVTVLLDLFGRETPVELTFEQVTKL
jgi:transcriptional antiterminator NusG